MDDYPLIAARTGATDTTTIQGATMEGVFHQLAQCLVVLGDETELMLESRVAGESNPAHLRTWLQPKARQAEAAMHQLRELHLAQTSAGTELSQSLTVLVLVADMLVQGQLYGDSARDSFDLLRRNAERAMKSLHELRAQFDTGALPGEPSPPPDAD